MNRCAARLSGKRSPTSAKRSNWRTNGNRPMVRLRFPASSPRLKLQSDYAQALMWSKGFAVEETKAAFARVRELAAQGGNPGERFGEYNGRWVRYYTRGELSSARDAAEAFLREAEAENRATESGAARTGPRPDLPLPGGVRCRPGPSRKNACRSQSGSGSQFALPVQRRYRNCRGGLSRARLMASWRCQSRRRADEPRGRRGAGVWPCPDRRQRPRLQGPAGRPARRSCGCDALRRAPRPPRQRSRHGALCGVRRNGRVLGARPGHRRTAKA